MGLARRSSVNFREGPILKKILIFALPIFLGSVFQQMYHMVDSIVVGRYVSADALAAVGSSSTLSNVLVGIMSGMPMGASIVAAQFLGAERKDRIKSTLSTTLVFLVMLAILISAVGNLFAPQIMRLLRVPDKIMNDAVLYFRIYVSGIIFIALYNFFASFLRALGDSTTPLIFLIVASVLNIAGDLLFVIKFNMGVAGVGWATVISQAVSVVLCYVYVHRTSEHFRFRKGEFVFERSIFREIIRLGVPSSLQYSLSGLGTLLVQGLINTYGTVSMAAYAAANRMEQICNMPFSGISMAMAMYVGQNIGARNESRAQKGRHECLVCQCLLAVFMSLLIFFCGSLIMKLFVKSSEVDVIHTGTAFMKRWAPFVILHAVTNNTVAFLRGTGDSIGTMSTVMIDLIRRMAFAYLFALVFRLGFMGIALAIPLGWVISAVFSNLRYRSGVWRKKAVKTD